MRARRTLLQYVVPIVVGWALGCDNPASPKPSADLLPPLTGSIKVSAPTTGSDLDPNGYTATLDLLQSQSVPTNGSTTFSGVLLGVHAVQLSGVASNCSLNSSNPQTVTLTGSSATASFSVNCTATTGSLTVTTSTTGSNLDPDGYTVTVDGNQKAIGINNSVTFSGLSPGNHSVQLNGLAQNCTVSSNPRTVSITAGSTTKTTFSVGCTATTGTLKVTTSTSGSVPTSNYTVTVDWNAASAQQIAPNNGSVTFSNLSATGHSVALSGFPANCTVTSANPQSVNVPAGGTATVAFKVSCTATATTGTLTIATSTMGQNLPASYTVTATGPSFPTGESESIGANATVSAPGIVAGDYTVQLSGVPSNCTVSGANPRTVTVPAGGTGSTTFAVSCTGTTTTGTLTIATSTTGQGLPASYTVTATGPSFPTGESESIGTNATVSAPGIVAGDYTVQLSGVPSNCMVSGANPRTVTVPAGGTGSTTFSVSCTGTATTGTLTVTTTTTGSNLDLDGYTVTVSGSGGTASRPIATTNGTSTFTDVPVGSYQVTLSGIAGNCSVTNANPQTVNVPAGGTATTNFDVTCTTGTITISNTTTGSNLDPDGYAVIVTASDGTQEPATMATNGSVTGELSTGSYQVQLTPSSVAANCTVTSANPQTVNVPAGGTVTVNFNVTCSASTP